MYTVYVLIDCGGKSKEEVIKERRAWRDIEDYYAYILSRETIAKVLSDIGFICVLFKRLI